MKNYNAFFILAFVFFLSSCAQLSNVGFRSYKNNFESRLDQQTREEKLYRDFETVAIAKVTYFDRNLADNYYNYLQTHNAISDKNKPIYEQFKSQAQKRLVFWVNLYSSDYESSNISDKNSFWSVYLNCNHTKLYPSKIEHILPDNPLNAWLYLKSKTYWSQNYIVYFDNKCNVNNPDFNMSSIIGNLNFKF